MIKTISLLTRKPGMTHEQFMTHWWRSTRRWPAPCPGLRRYVQSHILAEPTRPDIPTTEIEVDGIAELWYDDRAAMARAHASPEARILFADGALFIGTHQGLCGRREGDGVRICLGCPRSSTTREASPHG